MNTKEKMLRDAIDILFEETPAISKFLLQPHVVWKLQNLANVCLITPTPEIAEAYKQTYRGIETSVYTLITALSMPERTTEYDFIVYINPNLMNQEEGYMNQKKALEAKGFIVRSTDEPEDKLKEAEELTVDATNATEERIMELERKTEDCLTRLDNIESILLYLAKPKLYTIQATIIPNGQYTINSIKES